MIEDEAAQQVVAFYDAILKSRGVALAPDNMILDYGCGSGRHTYEYIDAGFRNAFGYDVQNYVALRSPSDREHFRFDPRPDHAGGYPTMTRIPWPDETFDFVFATSVFEHVTDQELAYAEIHRVLKPGGSFLNIFPSKWRPIEAHINIPFGGVFTWRPYLRLCAALGIRGLNQETCTAIKSSSSIACSLRTASTTCPGSKSRSSSGGSSASSNMSKTPSSAIAPAGRDILPFRSNSFPCCAKRSALPIPGRSCRGR
jgi:methyltransferase family protein